MSESTYSMGFLHSLPFVFFQGQVVPGELFDFFGTNCKLQIPSEVKLAIYRNEAG